MITIGIDPHKASHTAVALDASGVTLGELRVAADTSTLARLRAWAAPWPERVWAIEGAGGLGRLLAQQRRLDGLVCIGVEQHPRTFTDNHHASPPPGTIADARTHDRTPPRKPQTARQPPITFADRGGPQPPTPPRPAPHAPATPAVDPG